MVSKTHTAMGRGSLEVDYHGKHLGISALSSLENADYEHEIERLTDNLLTAYEDGAASRDGEVDALRAELAALKMPADA